MSIVLVLGFVLSELLSCLCVGSGLGACVDSGLCWPWCLCWFWPCSYVLCGQVFGVVQPSVWRCASKFLVLCRFLKLYLVVFVVLDFGDVHAFLRGAGAVDMCSGQVSLAVLW